MVDSLNAARPIFQVRTGTFAPARRAATCGRSRSESSSTADAATIKATASHRRSKRLIIRDSLPVTHFRLVLGASSCKIRAMEPKATPETQILQTPSIVRTPGICGGKPRIDGHRIKVEHIAVCHERMGMSPDEIVNSHPTITLAQVHAALAYYYDHKVDIDAEIEEGERVVEQLTLKSPPSKLQKLLEARKANGSDSPFPPR